MERTYRCIPQLEFGEGIYKLVPIRDEDKYAIMQWRNEQIDILRQKELLTKEKQEWYFKNIVDKLFELEKPDQLLFSFLENDILIGYGGLVHIDWESRNAEISFITATERNKNNYQFKNDWEGYLVCLKKIADTYLGFSKIYTYVYDIRPQLFKILNENNFLEEARLKKQVVINDKLYDVLIHSYFFDIISFRIVKKKDMLLLLQWANDAEVRNNSFNQNTIELESHRIWFENKIIDPNCLLLIAIINEKDVGQVRFEKINDDTFEIDFSIGKNFRGQGLGSKVIKMGVLELFKTKALGKRVIGRVKRDNISSQRSFLNAGFKLMEDSGSNNEIDIYYFDK